MPKLAKHGLVTGYHAHGFDFIPLTLNKKKTNVIDILMDELPKEFLFQADVGNILQGNGCPLTYIKKYPGRQYQLHLKEFCCGRYDLPIGAGNMIDWAKIFAAAKKAGVKQYILELGDYWADPVECIIQERSILKNLGLFDSCCDCC